MDEGCEGVGTKDEGCEGTEFGTEDEGCEGERKPRESWDGCRVILTST